MAITTNAIVISRPPVMDWTMASLYSADFSGGEDLVAASTGKYIYVKRIQILAQSVTDITFTIGAGQDTGITTIYLGPMPLPDAGGSCVIDFGECAMKVAVSTALSIDSSAACPASVLVWYQYGV